jgi:AraC-like DNA-binding protein
VNSLRHFASQPHASLRSYVREIVWVRSEEPRVQVLLPETTLTMVLRQAGGTFLGTNALPLAIVSGLQRTARRILHAAGSSLVIVRFTETGAAAVLRDRVDRLYSQTAALDTFLPRRDIDDVQNVLAETSDPMRQILVVERFLLARVDQHRKIMPQVEIAAKIIRDSGGRLPITAIARSVGMSQSSLERSFRAAVGTSPKMLSRLSRLQNVCRLWDRGKTLTDISVEAGYSDQPHMVHDFRLLTGSSPEDFFRSGAPRNLPTFYK